MEYDEKGMYLNQKVHRPLSKYVLGSSSKQIPQKEIKEINDADSRGVVFVDQLHN